MNERPGDDAPDGPLVELSYRELQVAKFLGRGWDHKRIAAHLKLSEATVGGYVQSAAGKFGNPDELSPRTLVMLWAAHQRWVVERQAKSA